MAQDRLTATPARVTRFARQVDPRAAGPAAVVLAAGSAVEVAHGLSAVSVTDWAVGAGFTVAAVRGALRRPRSVPTAHLVLGLATAMLWFGATAAHLLPPSRWQGSVVAATAIAYRGPLLHWAVRTALGGRHGFVVPALLVTGYAASLTGSRPSAFVSAGTALALAVVLSVRARRRQDDARRVTRLRAEVLVVLGLTWAAFAAALVPPTPRPVLDAVVLLGAAAVLGSRAASVGLSGAVGSLVVELGPLSGRRPPVSATLARALADPQVDVRVYAPETGWTDELGRPVADPVTTDPDRVTVAVAPDGSQVALVHGEPGVADGPLARAAAAAALLALESVRLEARVRQEAAAVRESTERLVTVDDEERRALAERLNSGPLSRLERLRGALARGDDLAALTEELDHVMTDLGDLAAGLDPGGIGTDGLARSLVRLCDGMGLPVAHDVSPAADGLPADVAALTYFVVAEALTNVARHAGAERARLVLDVRTRELLLTVEDDGRGGAAIATGRGLQGLVDRVRFAGGRLTLDSPPDGPTRLHVVVPLLAGPPG